MNLIELLLDTSDFPARWNCGAWSPPHGWTHVLSDVAIFGAYAAIPKALHLPRLAAVNAKLEAEAAKHAAADAKLREYTDNLEVMNQQLQQFSSQVVDREDRVIELKREVNDLLAQCGRDPRYGVDDPV